MRLNLPVRWSRKIGAGYIAGALLLLLFLRNTDWPSISAGIRSVAWPVLAGAVALRLTALVVSSIRWRYLLSPVKRVGVLSLTAAMMIGMAVNTGVSMQAAEFVRPYILSRHEDIDYSSTMSTVMVEWFLDLMATLALFVTALIWVRSRGGSEPAGMNQAISLIVLASFAGLAALWSIRQYAVPLRRFFENSLSLAPQRMKGFVSEQLHKFALGLEILERPREMTTISALSLITSALTAFACWASLAAFGLTLPPVASLILLGIISIGGMVPTPGAVGGFHAICQLALMAFFKIGAAAAVLPVIGMHAVLYIPGSVIGLICIFDYRHDKKTDTK